MPLYPLPGNFERGIMAFCLTHFPLLLDVLLRKCIQSRASGREKLTWLVSFLCEDTHPLPVGFSVLIQTAVLDSKSDLVAVQVVGLQ